MNQERQKTCEKKAASGLKDFYARFVVWAGRRPITAIMLVSLVAVVINCYPVIFCGKSFVSPYCVPGLVYNWQVPAQGIQDPSPFDPQMRHSVHGSDTAAAMWWAVPVGFIQSRAILEHGELPLWNRYGHAGDTLIAQGVSMLGDPLQLIVILGRGSAVAWDVKFLTAKFLFCLGFGLLIRRIFNQWPLSLLFAALGAYCGAFFYINNHPVFFVFCYAPWILFAALQWLDLKTQHPIGWGLLWLLANVSCFNAGHVEVAVVLIGGLNLAALAQNLAVCGQWEKMLQVVGRMAMSTVFFLGLTAPVWLPFLAALKNAFTVHANINVIQIPLALWPGLFDDLFHLLLRKNDTESAFSPGTSLLILAGCCLSLAHWRQFKAGSFFWINAAAIVFWSGWVFGWVPASLIEKIPLLNRVGHLYTDFSYLLVIHLTIQSAYGFAALARVGGHRQTIMGMGLFGIVFGVIYCFYPFGYNHQSIPWNYFFTVAAGAIGAPLLFVYVRHNAHRFRVLGFAGVMILGFTPNFRFALYHSGDDALLMLPGPRMQLNFHSLALERIKQRESEPFRAVGWQWNLAGDYSAVYEIEDIRSCAPLSNQAFMDLVRTFPGMQLTNGWMIEIGNPIAAQPLLNLLNVKYVLSRSVIHIEPGVEFKVVDQSDFCVIENRQTWPRAFFVNQIQTLNSREEFIKYLMEGSRKPFIALTADEQRKYPELQQLEQGFPPFFVPATNYLLAVNSTGFDIDAPTAGVVCLTEGQSPDFIVRVNGESRPVLSVNQAFKGVYLDRPGQYHIDFSYQPRHWRLACNLFWVSLAGVLGLILLSFTRHSGHPERRQAT